MAVLLWFLGPMVSDMASMVRLIIWWLQVARRCCGAVWRDSNLSCAPPLMGAGGVWGVDP